LPPKLQEKLYTIKDLDKETTDKLVYEDIVNQKVKRERHSLDAFILVKSEYTQRANTLLLETKQQLECIVDLFKDKKELDHKFHKGDEGISKSFYVRNLHHTLFFDPSDDTVNIFYHSIKKIDEIITVIVNHEKVIEMKIEPNRWYIKKIHRLAEITHIRIDNSSKVIYEKFFDESFKKIFPIKSYITDAKNN
jgi:hypothetical protein